MADFLPQHSIRVAPLTIWPLVCDACGTTGQPTDGRLPDGWTVEQLPSCLWPFDVYVSCPPCAQESGAPMNRTTGAA